MSQQVGDPDATDMPFARADSAGPERRRSWWRHERIRSALTVGLGLAVTVILWEIAAQVVQDDVLLPSPVDAASKWVYYLHHSYPESNVPLWRHALHSTVRILIGFVAGAAIGVTIGALMAATRVLRNFFDPFVEATRPVPALAFVPVLIVWFGVGDTPKVVLIMIGVVPIMTVATVAALDRVPREMIHAARCLGGSDLYAMLHVRLRAALAPLITGMRLAMGVSWTSIVAAEMIVASNGLGYMILQAGLYLDTSIIFAGIFSIALLGIGFDALFRGLQRRLDPSTAVR